MKQKVAITGAFSYSGKYIARRLLARGEEVITLTNHPNRPDPFKGKIKAYPLNFMDDSELIKNLKGIDILYNTYWIRFDKGSNTRPAAVENTKRLIQAAAKAGVKRIVHISITNPSADSHLPYFWGKAANEKAVIESGISYGILRPTVLFGKEDVLINNIAWILRRLPVFGLPGDGSYKLQPVYVDDLAELAVEVGYKNENIIWDAVGPDIFTFKEMAQLIGDSIKYARPLLSFQKKRRVAKLAWKIGCARIVNRSEQSMLRNWQGILYEIKWVVCFQSFHWHKIIEVEIPHWN